MALSYASCFAFTFWSTAISFFPARRLLALHRGRFSVLTLQASPVARHRREVLPGLHRVIALLHESGIGGIGESGFLSLLSVGEGGGSVFVLGFEIQSVLEGADG